MKKLIIIAIMALMVTVGCGGDTETQEPINEDPKESLEPEMEKEDEEDPLDDQLTAILSRMTTDEKIGQLVMVGIEGETLSEDEADLIIKHKIGGFILFGRNISDLEGTRNLIDHMKNLNLPSEVPLLLAVDEEGGSVTRLSGIYRNLPDQWYLGERGSEDLARDYGRIQGKKLISLGINVNFSPVLDVNSNPQNPVIGRRAISQNPETVARFGTEVFKGIMDSQAIPVGKHFPGHGDTATDSHVSLPVIEKTLDQLRENELVPFKRVIEEGIPAIMVGHLLIPKLDSQPATFSEVLINGLLREDFGFKGVVFSDDLTMGAVTQTMKPSDAALEFILSGGDVALICHGMEEPLEAIENIRIAYNEGILSEEELDIRVRRILQLKLDFNLVDTPLDRNLTWEINKDIEKLLD